MIGGIAESPLTIKALVKWRDAIKEGQVLLRDVIDLDATYGGSPDVQPVPGSATIPNSEETTKTSQSSDAENTEDIELDDDEDIEENNMSLAAMEEALMPEVIQTFDKIADIYGKLKKVQDRRLSRMLKGEPATAQSEHRYAKL